MFTALAVWFGIQAGQVFAVFKINKHFRQHDLLINWNPPIKTLPVIDPYLAKYAGTPSKFDKYCALKIVAGVRKAVQYKAFEHVVVGVMNRQSMWYTSKATSLLSNFLKRIKR